MSQQSAPPKPLPVPDELSAGYWEAAARHVLAVQRCDDCGSFCHPPDTICPTCRSLQPSFTWTPVSGAGTVTSWATMQTAFLPGFRDDIPYLIVEVSLDEAPHIRILGRLVDGPDTALHLGDRVEVVWVDMAEGVSVPEFRLAAPGVL